MFAGHYSYNSHINHNKENNWENSCQEDLAPVGVEVVEVEYVVVVVDVVVSDGVVPILLVLVGVGTVVDVVVLGVE